MYVLGNRTCSGCSNMFSVFEPFLGVRTCSVCSNKRTCSRDFEHAEAQAQRADKGGLMTG